MHSTTNIRIAKLEKVFCNSSLFHFFFLKSYCKYQQDQIVGRTDSIYKANAFPHILALEIHCLSGKCCQESGNFASVCKKKSKIKKERVRNRSRDRDSDRDGGKMKEKAGTYIWPIIYLNGYRAAPFCAIYLVIYL